MADEHRAVTKCDRGHAEGQNWPKIACRTLWTAPRQTDRLNVGATLVCQSDPTWYQGLETCAGVIVSEAARRSILVGGGAAWPVKLPNFASGVGRNLLWGNLGSEENYFPNLHFSV